MRLCPSQLQLSLNPLDGRSVGAGGSAVIALRGDAALAEAMADYSAAGSEKDEWSSGMRSV